MAVNTGISIISVALTCPWYKHINLGRLDLNSQTNDILGQLFGSKKQDFAFLQALPTRNPEILEKPMCNGLVPSALH